MIDYDTAVTGEYDLKLKVTFTDNAGVTQTFTGDAFTAYVYELTASTAVDQIYIIDNTADSYTVPAFTCTKCTEAGFAMTYELLTTDASGNTVDAAPYLSWLTGFDATITSRVISFQSNDAADAGGYALTIKVSLDDSPVTEASTPIDFYLVYLNLNTMKHSKTKSDGTDTT